MQRANTKAWFAQRPKPPGQYFVDVTVGEWIINSFVYRSKVAVVSRPATFDPCPSSVYA
jgi:hypothetical protein